MEWYRYEKAAGAKALRRGEYPDLVMTMASGMLDESVAFHQEWGIFAILAELREQRERARVPNELLLPTRDSLPLVDQASRSFCNRSALPRASSTAVTGLGVGADPRGKVYVVDGMDWEMSCAWWYWGACQPRAQSSRPGGCEASQPPRKV